MDGKGYQEQIRKRIRRSSRSVFLRKDFSDLGGYDQIGRALRRLTASGDIVRIGYGLYAKARKSGVSGNSVPAKSLPDTAREALRRLNIQTVPTKLERAARAGTTTQVPSGRRIGIRKGRRTTRKIGFEGRTVTFEQQA